jgi:hypothetical protein
VGPEIQGGLLDLRIYHQAIRHITTLVWWPGCQTASAKKKLSRVKRLACLGTTGAMRTNPTNAVEALICLPHLSYWYGVPPHSTIQVLPYEVGQKCIQTVVPGTKSK